MRCFSNETAVSENVSVLMTERGQAVGKKCITHSFVPLACAVCDDSLPFWGSSSIPLCYVAFLSTLFHQLAFHPPSLHLAICFFVYLSASLFPNLYIILFCEFLFSYIFCTHPNHCNLFSRIVSVMVGRAGKPSKRVSYCRPQNKCAILRPHKLHGAISTESGVKVVE